MRILNHPYLLGASIAVMLFAAGVFLMLRAPSALVFLREHKAWFDLGTYTASLFALLVWWCWKWRARLTFWGVFAFLLAAHLLGFVLYIQQIRPLSPLNYCLIVPAEAFILAFLAERGTTVLQAISRRLGRIQ